MELKIVLANVIRHFHLRSLEPQDKLMIVGELILRPRNGLKVEFISRKLVADPTGQEPDNSSNPNPLTCQATRSI